MPGQKINLSQNLSPLSPFKSIWLGAEIPSDGGIILISVWVAAIIKFLKE